MGIDKALKVGDRVRFMDATGGGVVRRVLRSSGVVYVEDESGFEVPVLQSEVLKVEGPETSLSSKESPLPSPNKATSQPEIRPTVKRSSDSEGERLNVSLCYLPEEGGQIGRCRYEVYLVNDSNYDLFVAYSSGRGAEQELRYSGVVPFDSSEELESFDPLELPERSRTTVQLLAFKEGGIAYQPKQAMSFELKIDGARFLKEGAFVESPYFDDGAITFELVKEDQPLVTKKVEAEQLASEMMRAKVQLDSPKRRARKGVSKHKGEPLVVDLHINELVDSTLGMEPKDMLEIQLEKVEEVLRSRRKPNHVGEKVIFIHGKGEGVLRKAVWDLIHRKFPRHDLQDASFQEYGFGATQVTIR